MWDTDEIINAKKYWFVITECLKVMNMHFSGKFHAWMHIHVKLLQSKRIIEVIKYFSVLLFIGNIYSGKACVLMSLSIYT